MTEPSHQLIAELVDRFQVEWRLSTGQDVVTLPSSLLTEFAEAAQEAGFDMCVDVTAADYLGARTPRFELVVGLLSTEHRLRLRLLVPVEESEPTVPSLVPVYPGANFFEREAFDMFGIIFDGHPDLTRILMPDDWEGHPLRRDYGTGTVPVQFKEAPQVRS